MIGIFLSLIIPISAAIVIAIAAVLILKYLKKYKNFLQKRSMNVLLYYINSTWSLFSRTYICRSQRNLTPFWK